MPEAPKGWSSPRPCYRTLVILTMNDNDNRKTALSSNPYVKITVIESYNKKEYKIKILQSYGHSQNPYIVAKFGSQKRKTSAEYTLPSYSFHICKML
jgi:hypothetical protein